MRSGLLAYFGDATRPHAKWLSLARVLADPSSAGASYIDVRLPERPAAGFPAGARPPDASAAGDASAGLDRRAPRNRPSAIDWPPGWSSGTRPSGTEQRRRGATPPSTPAVERLTPRRRRRPNSAERRSDERRASDRSEPPAAQLQRRSRAAETTRD